MLKRMKNVILLGIGITVVFVTVWFLLFIGTAKANGPTDLTIPTLHYQGTKIAGTNPDYYPKYGDLIYLTGDLNYDQPMANATSCYQPIYKQYYGDEYSTNSGYRVIYDITGMSYIIRDDNPKILTCSGTAIITVEYDKLPSGIHQ